MDTGPSDPLHWFIKGLVLSLSIVLVSGLVSNSIHRTIISNNASDDNIPPIYRAILIFH